MTSDTKKYPYRAAFDAIYGWGGLTQLFACLDDAIAQAKRQQGRHTS